jgi:hypothetical protein
LNRQGLPGPPPNARKADASTITRLDNLPLYFVENKGQVDSRVMYYAKIRNGRVYFTGEEIIYQFLLRRARTVLRKAISKSRPPG